MCKFLGANVTIFEQKPLNEFNKSTYNYLKKNNIKIYFDIDPRSIDIRNNDWDLVIVSPSVNYELVKSLLLLKSKTEVIGEIELGYRFCKSPIIAVTGTNGKSTTTDIINNILSSKYKTLLAGNMGIGFAEKVLENSDTELTVLEVCAAQLETIKYFKPKISVITNITSEHLDRYKTENNYRSIKKRIVANQKEDDFVVLNYDNTYSSSIAREIESKVIYFSAKRELEEGAFISNNRIYYKDKNEMYEIIRLDQIKNKGNIENYLAAVCVSFVMSIGIQDIRNCLMQYNGLEHRIQYIGSKDKINFYNDSKATNPEATVHAIKTISENLILITGGKADKNSNFTSFVNIILTKNVKYVILIGELSKILKFKILNAGYSMDRIFIASSLEEAIFQSMKVAVSGDNILFSPGANSRDMFENHYKRGLLFNQIINNLLSNSEQKGEGIYGYNS